MGAYSPVPQLAELADFGWEASRQLIDELGRRGTDFTGVLYAGAIQTADGPRLLELNCRLGDPETQVLVTRLESDIVEIMWEATQGGLFRLPEPRWSDRSALCVVIANQAYPSSSVDLTRVEGLAKASTDPDVHIFHAGTYNDSDDGKTGQFFSRAGRVLGVTGVRPNLAEAREVAYLAASRLLVANTRCRNDIGSRALGSARSPRTEAVDPRTPHFVSLEQRLADAATQMVNEDAGVLMNTSDISEEQMLELEEAIAKVARVLSTGSSSGESGPRPQEVTEVSRRLDALRSEVDAAVRQSGASSAGPED